jgi:hypothetical protein
MDSRQSRTFAKRIYVPKSISNAYIWCRGWEFSIFSPVNYRPMKFVAWIKMVAFT